jgi:ATP-dependent exoDNAse (exonuclease V) alpha subunit
MRLTREQTAAADVIEGAIAAGVSTFCVHGAAGTGKTHLLAALAHKFPDAVVCALSNRATALLRHKIGRPAYTIHRLIKQFRGLDKYGDPIFDANDYHGSIALLDEASVVNAKLAADLVQKFDTVIAFGDPGQLDPVQGLPGFPHADATLHKIHRQAQGSAIIRQAHAVRNCQGYADDGPNFRVRILDELTYGDLLEADIALAHYRVTRDSLNTLMRESRGITGATLKVGEPIMATKNDYGRSIFNGEIWHVVEDCALCHDPLIINDGEKTQTLKNVAIEGLWAGDPDAIQFRLGYAQTVYAAQGSEWGSVLLVNQKPKKPKWVYTGITRASKRILVETRR